MSPIDSITDDELQALRDRVTTLEQERDAAVADNAALKLALADAIESMEDMRAYVPDYFAQKWDHGGDIAKARASHDAAHPGASLLTRLAAAERVVEKLPKYADTGQPITDDLVWMIVPNGPDGMVVERKSISLAFRGYAAYSTEAAALAAKGGAS